LADDDDDNPNVINMAGHAKSAPPPWPGGMVKTTGAPKANMLNAKAALKRLGCIVRFNRFKHRFLVNGQKERRISTDRTVNLDLGEVDDNTITRLRDYVSAAFGGFDPLDQHVLDAIKNLGLQNEFHPVTDYLDSLKWDGVKRLDPWLITTFGVEESDYTCAVGRLTLLAAVCRVRQPGCKFDTAPVIIGPQGVAKSTALRILAVKDEWFTDQPILALDTQKQMERMAGKWLYEIADLDGMRRAETTYVKAFMSRQFDNARMAYGRIAEDRARQCVFFATTNEAHFLRDDTGNRRWWPAATMGEANLAWLEGNRNQLWAEANEAAKALLDDGTMRRDALALPPALWPVAEAMQQARMVAEPWTERVADLERKGLMPRGRYFSTEVADLLQLATAQQHQVTWSRIGVAMRANNYSGPHLIRKIGGGIGGHVGNGYVPREDRREAMEEPEHPTPPPAPPNQPAPVGGSTQSGSSPPADDDVPF
jgi:hypothetical protein